MKNRLVKVIPRSAKNEIVKQPDGSYKIKLTAAPADGKANKQLIELLSKEWGVAKSKMKIVRGKTARNKLIEIVDN